MTTNPWKLIDEEIKRVGVRRFVGNLVKTSPVMVKSFVIGISSGLRGQTPRQARTEHRQWLARETGRRPA
jgi:hypothetical protein